MKKKYNLLFRNIIIFIFFLTNLLSLTNISYASSRCENLMQDIINAPNASEFQEHPVFPYEDEVVFEIAAFYEKSKDDWVWGVNDSKYNFISEKDMIATNPNGNLVVGRINDPKILPEIKIGDELTKINDKSISEYNSDEIFEYLYFPKEKVKFSFKNQNNKIIDYTINQTWNSDATIVDLEISIKAINNIDIKDNTFQADIEKKVAYKNYSMYEVVKKHLNYEKDKFWMCKFTPEEHESMQMWNPWVEPVNSINTNETLISHEYVINTSEYWKNRESYKDTTWDDNYALIEKVTRGTYTFSNDYFLKSFPFDRQLLTLKFADPERGIKTLKLNQNLLNDRKLEFFKDNSRILEWNIEKVRTKNFLLDNPTSLSDGLVIEIEIERDSEYYIFKVIFPIILILMVCWSVFWIHPRELESKLTITIVCLLSLIAYNFVIDEELPKLGYLTLMDYIILTSYFFATLPNFLSIYCFANFKKNKKDWIIIDQKSRIYGPMAYLLIIFTVIASSSMGNEHAAAFLGFLK